jgi:hypothetical protein
MSQQNQNQQPDPNAGVANTPAATPGHPTRDPHITQQPRGATVPFAELQQQVRGDRSVHSSVRSLVAGVRQRLEEIASQTNKDADAIRNEVREVAGQLNADEVARSVIENTPAKSDPDPNANQSVAPVINR